MAISMLSFQMTLSKNDVSIQNTLLQRIKERNMAPYYLEVCNYFEYTMDTTLYNAMKAVNDSVINQKKEAIALKKDNGSDDDVLDLLISLVGFLSSVNSRLITTMKLEIRTMQLNHTRHVLITRCRIQ